MSLPKLKLLYFDIKARAEVTRLLFDVAGIPFEDVGIKREEWPALKGTMPLGQIPVLWVDGKPLAQQVAIERYAAQLAGLYPTDPWEAAKVDELLEFHREIHQLFIPTYGIKDLEERKKARELLLGPLKAKLTKLQEMLGSSDYFCGSSKPTYPDIAIYFLNSLLASGFLDGLPTNLLDDFPTLKAHHNRVAALPAVAKRYEGGGDQNAAYRVLP